MNLASTTNLTGYTFVDTLLNIMTVLSDEDLIECSTQIFYLLKTKVKEQASLNQFDVYQSNKKQVAIALNLQKELNSLYVYFDIESPNDLTNIACNYGLILLTLFSGSEDAIKNYSQTQQLDVANCISEVTAMKYPKLIQFITMCITSGANRLSIDNIDINELWVYSPEVNFSSNRRDPTDIITVDCIDHLYIREYITNILNIAYHLDTKKIETLSLNQLTFYKYNANKACVTLNTTEYMPSIIDVLSTKIEKFPSKNMLLFSVGIISLYLLTGCKKQYLLNYLDGKFRVEEIVYKAITNETQESNDVIFTKYFEAILFIETCFREDAISFETIIHHVYVCNKKIPYIIKYSYIKRIKNKGNCKLEEFQYASGGCGEILFISLPYYEEKHYIPYYLKKIHKQGSMAEMASNEDTISKLARSSSLLKSYVSTQEHICFEFKNGLTLQNYVAHYGPVNEKEAKQIFIEVINGLIDFQKINKPSKLAHRDIKPDNIIIFKRNGVYHASLIDYGSAQKIGSEAVTLYVGTAEYCAPEIKNLKVGDHYDEKSDYWSLGLTLLYALKQNTDLSIPYTISLEAISFLEHCIQTDPSKRFKLAEDMLLHPFLKYAVPSGLYMNKDFELNPEQQRVSHNINGILLSHYTSGKSA